MPKLCVVRLFKWYLSLTQKIITWLSQLTHLTRLSQSYVTLILSFTKLIKKNIVKKIMLHLNLGFKLNLSLISRTRKGVIAIQTHTVQWLLKAHQYIRARTDIYTQPQSLLWIWADRAFVRSLNLICDIGVSYTINIITHSILVQVWCHSSHM